MKRVQFIAQVVIGLSLPWLSCTNSTGPSFKDPRTYEWTIDTLKAPEPSYYTQLYKLYAANARDVYVVGFNDYYGRGAMWHYDGFRWSSVPWWRPGPERQADFADITGFGSSTIIAVGSQSGGPENPQKSLIAHFDGVNWSQIDLPGGSLWTVGGDSPSNIWTAGVMNSVFHYDGSAWSKIDVNNRLWFGDIEVLEGRVFALAYKIDDAPLDTTWYYFLRWNGVQWDTLGTDHEVSGQPFSPPFGVHRLSIIGGELYSGSGYPNTNIYRLEHGRWAKVDNLSGDVFGASKHNMFNINGFGGVRHFNGTDWYSYPEFESLPFRLTHGWTDGREVFIVGSDDIRSVILHGK